MESNLSQRHFWIRKLHSLSGLVPIGAFLVEHLISNAYALSGEKRFNEHVEFLLSIPQPFLAILEWGLILMPIAFHGLVGVYLSRQGSITAIAYPKVRNWMYVLQRVTGMITLLYIIVHLWQFRLGHSGIVADPSFAQRAYQEVAVVLRNPVWFAVYTIGLASTVFHFANGLGLFCYHWGITVGKTSQRVVATISIGLGVGLFILGIASMRAFLS